jgi:hypothetical protein
MPVGSVGNPDVDTCRADAFVDTRVGEDGTIEDDDCVINGPLGGGYCRARAVVDAASSDDDGDDDRIDIDEDDIDNAEDEDIGIW